MRWLRWAAFVSVPRRAFRLRGLRLVRGGTGPGGGTCRPPRDVHLSREVYGHCALMQTFVAARRWVQRIEMYPRQSANPPKGPLRVRILDGRTDTFTLLLQKTSISRRSISTRRCVFRCPPRGRFGRPPVHAGSHDAGGAARGTACDSSRAGQPTRGRPEHRLPAGLGRSEVPDRGAARNDLQQRPASAPLAAGAAAVGCRAAPGRC